MQHTRTIIATLTLLTACAFGAGLRTSEPTRESAQIPAVQRVLDEVSAERLRRGVDRLAAFGTRHTLSETESSTRGIGAARRWIRDEMTASIGADGRMAVRFDPHDIPPGSRRLPDGARVVNVIAEIPGAMPEARDRYYYVMGHYDSRNSNTNGEDPIGDAPGANDDASGVALLMEMARVLADEKLDATVVFIATAGEEQGLYGARYHAEAASAQGLDIRAVLNNDTVGDPSAPAGFRNGRDTSGLIRVFSEGLPREMTPIQASRMRSLSGEGDGPSRQIARYIHDVAQRERTDVQPMLVFRLDRFLRGGDHSAFLDFGYPGVRFTEVDEDYTRQHQDIRTENGVAYGDLAEHVDEEYLAGVTRLNTAVLMHLANAPSAPADARLIVAQLTNETEMRWSPSPEPDVAGYEIVWRETTDWQWRGVKDVGMETSGIVGLSKDNHFFGVRAYDRDGYRSPVSFAGAARE